MATVDEISGSDRISVYVQFDAIHYCPVNDSRTGGN